MFADLIENGTLVIATFTVFIHCSYQNLTLPIPFER